MSFLHAHLLLVLLSLSGVLVAGGGMLFVRRLVRAGARHVTRRKRSRRRASR